jgi:hypothetical protein
LQRNIAVEIKNTEIDETQVAELLSKVLFSDVLRDPKIRYEGNGQDYAYARRLDDDPLPRGNAITPDFAAAASTIGQGDVTLTPTAVRMSGASSLAAAASCWSP